MRGAAAVAIAVAIGVGGCAAQDDDRIELNPAQAAEAYREAMCPVLATDGELDAALAAERLDVVFEAARARAQLLSGRAITVSEQHDWPDGTDALWQVDNALAEELSWVLAVADASSTEVAQAVPPPDLAQRAALDGEVRAALDLPADDDELCG